MYCFARSAIHLIRHAKGIGARRRRFGRSRGTPGELVNTDLETVAVEQTKPECGHHGQLLTGRRQRPEFVGTYSDWQYFAVPLGFLARACADNTARVRCQIFVRNLYSPSSPSALRQEWAHARATKNHIEGPRHLGIPLEEGTGAVEAPGRPLPRQLDAGLGLPDLSAPSRRCWPGYPCKVEAFSPCLVLCGVVRLERVAV